MYTLTLEESERDAIDWVGDRYAHGYKLRKVLQLGEVRCPWPDCDPEWHYNVPLEFILPEYVAWQVEAIRDEDEGRWTLFPPSLARKLNDFCDNIV